jgi:hypothetical protein
MVPPLSTRRAIDGMEPAVLTHNDPSSSGGLALSGDEGPDPTIER